MRLNIPVSYEPAAGEQFATEVCSYAEFKDPIGTTLLKFISGNPALMLEIGNKHSVTFQIEALDDDIDVYLYTGLEDDSVDTTELLETLRDSFITLFSSHGFVLLEKGMMFRDISVNSILTPTLTSSNTNRMLN